MNGFVVFSQGPLFPTDHELSLRAEGLTRPKRKRGRPPKPVQPPDLVNLSSTEKEVPIVLTESENIVHSGEDGKQRRRRKPTRFMEAIQGRSIVIVSFEFW